MKTIKKFIPDYLKVKLKRILPIKIPAVSHLRPISRCPCCGSDSILDEQILWEGLIRNWELSASEVEYMNRQQGARCKRCKANLRTMVLAYAMMRYENNQGLFKDFVKSRKFRRKQVLEINQAGRLTQYLKSLPGHTLAEYPEVDIQHLPYADASFDIVVHSDTLEHVPDPLLALRECLRVLKPGGYCVYTVPMILDRVTRSRHGLPPSHHGSESETGEDYLVHTEFGADAWKFAVESGFSEVRIYSLEYPAAQCLLCKK